MSNLNQTGYQLLPIDCWNTAVALLAKQLPAVDVQPITDKDFASGELVLNPPSVRVMYVNTDETPIGNQGATYETQHHFLAICGDNDLRSAPDQAFGSLSVAQQVKNLLAGARLMLPTNEITEPILIAATEPLPVKGIGVAYAVAFTVSGPAAYDAPNAYPTAPQEIANG